MVSALDPAGRRGVTTSSLTASDFLTLRDARSVKGGGIVIALAFGGELRFGDKRLGTTSYTT